MGREKEEGEGKDQSYSCQFQGQDSPPPPTKKKIRGKNPLSSRNSMGFQVFFLFFRLEGFFCPFALLDTTAPFSPPLSPLLPLLYSVLYRTFHFVCHSTRRRARRLFFFSSHAWERKFLDIWKNTSATNPLKCVRMLGGKGRERGGGLIVEPLNWGNGILVGKEVKRWGGNLLSYGFLGLLGLSSLSLCLPLSSSFPADDI